ncbi:MAG: hypothetical protein JXA44_06940 [Methanospirillaceae archaeon]|nr:hypothetical protein [Methanospirillaceae archaeon]
MAGHAGLLMPKPVPMAEVALLAVSPAHRGRGIMTFLEDSHLYKGCRAGSLWSLGKPGYQS